MLSTIEAQFISILISIFAGLAIGLLFDFYRTINYYVKPSKAFTHILDLLFWVVTGCVVFAILLRADFAELRIYTFIGISIGVFVYIKLFSEYIQKFYRFIFYAIAKIIRVIVILIVLPFKLLYNLLWGPAVAVKKGMWNLTGGIAKKIRSNFKKK
jgi:spore cortex biosynthesis protein YabQ